MEWKEDDFRAGDAQRKNKNEGGREFIGIFWECCKVYSRVYLNSRRSAFVGWCPKCARRVQVDVSPTGSRSRFFNVG